MKLQKLMGCFLAAFLVMGSAHAKEINAVIRLTDIKAIKTQEKSGDELYFDVMQYSNLGNSKLGRIPKKPDHWLSKDLAALKDVVLWQGKLKDNESVKVILTLVEQEFAPWDVDDMLGSIQLNLSNNKGKLKKEWMVPVFGEADEVEMIKAGEPQRYVFKGAGSKYEVSFRLEQK